MIYEFRCEQCSKTWDEVQPMDQLHDSKCPSCGKTVHRRYSPLAHTVDFTAGYDDGLGEYVTTKKHREKIMRDNNLRRVKAYG